tara:strand:+ start:198 stop:623 length:426 start_codon:yes stop_codon:yes gene_type:complete
VTPEAIVGVGGTLFKVDAAINFLFRLPYSRLHEREADALGLDNLVRACIDPAVAPGVWRAMGASENELGLENMTESRKISGGVFVEVAREAVNVLGELTSTHPPAEERERAMRAQLPSRAALFEERCGGYVEATRRIRKMG